MNNPMFTTLVHEQLPIEKLAGQTIARQEGTLTDTGALLIKTGNFTGRSPEDKFLVKDNISIKSVDWNKFNNPIDENSFLQLKDKLIAYLNNKTEIWARNLFACADSRYQLSVRVINENPWSNHFASNMLIEPDEDELKNFNAEWLIIQAPGFEANPLIDGTRQKNFTILSLKHKTILIGGSGYTGEIKKAVFTALNFLLPYEHNVLSMHCSANEGVNGDTALFFGLSGTGKTTLSADSQRKLIGDDEHGWSNQGVFNFEGGCYAKIINLSEECEPEIFHAIKPGALVENARLFKNSNHIDFSDKSITENTRTSYPLEYIPNAKTPALGGHPQNIFFLACDAYGVLPPISLLTEEQAMFYFINGYTAKIAGTEVGITEPKVTFSACFGAPFLPLHPEFYATLLGKKLKEHKVKVWLVNTGWTAGPYGQGYRISINNTRAMVNAALSGKLDTVNYQEHSIFHLSVPQSCPGISSQALLNPREMWPDQNAYDEAAMKLVELFDKNHQLYNHPQLS